MMSNETPSAPDPRRAHRPGAGGDVRERPILFSSAMVRAILEGKKTQTRRLIRDGLSVTDVAGGGVEPVVWWPRDALARDAKCPYGEPGDRLWVRETLWRNGGYVATDPAPHENAGKRPAIHMPRVDSRITLDIERVRVQRLQDISEDDAASEGVDAMDGHLDETNLCRRAKEMGAMATDSRVWFAALWDSINGERRVKVPKGWPEFGTTTETDRSAAWAANPWVWALTFRRVTP